MNAAAKTLHLVDPELVGMLAQPSMPAFSMENLPALRAMTLPMRPIPGDGVKV